MVQPELGATLFTPENGSKALLGWIAGSVSIGTAWVYNIISKSNDLTDGLVGNFLERLSDSTFLERLSDSTDLRFATVYSTAFLLTFIGGGYLASEISKRSGRLLTRKKIVVPGEPRAMVDQRSLQYPVAPPLKDPVFQRLLKNTQLAITDDDAYIKAYNSRFQETRNNRRATAYAIGAATASEGAFVQKLRQMPEIPDFSPPDSHPLQALKSPREVQEVQKTVLAAREQMSELLKGLYKKTYLNEVGASWRMTGDIGMAIEYADGWWERVFGKELTSYKPPIPPLFYARRKLAQLILK